MTSLCPGPLFTTPGLNQYSTPSSRTSTPSDIDRRFTRVPFNGIPWPKQSPVSRVYDVRNSSTKMILLNNKYTKKGCRLRGQTMNDGDVRAPDPSRHSGESPYVNRKSHVDCLTSSTPVFQPEVKTSLKWANKTQRPPLKFDDGSSVNYKRHTACMTSDDLRLMNWQRPRRSYTSSIIRESQKCKNPLLDDLNPGERLYLYSIAKVYSVDSMRRLKQNQYCQLLQKEGQRGGYSDAEYRRYMKYLSSQRKTQQGTSDTYQRRRIRSAPTNRDTQTDKTESSPSAVTQSEHAQSRPASSKSKSRSTSRPMSRASLASNKSHKKTRETPTATKSKSGTKPSKQANDGVTPTSKKPSGTKPSKASSDETKKDKSTPEKSKTSSSDRDNSKMAETENTDQKVTVVQIQEPQDEEPDEEEAQVRGEEDKVKDSEDTEDRMAPQNRGNSHKEGVDRPKSRLGERPRAKDNSDDDYSSDSDSSSSSSDESGADTSKSLSKSEPTESQTRSEPSKTSRSSQKDGSGAASPGSPTKPQVMTGSPPRLETTKKEGSPPRDGDHDASYSEDFSEASKSVSQSHASKSDDNKRKSDSSTNETSEKTSEKSQIKPAPLSESEGQSSSDTSSSVKPAQQTKIPSDTSTATSEDTSTSTSVPKVKVSQDDSKVRDQSYSDDFTESTSQSQSGDKVKGEKSPEVKEEKSEVRFKDEDGVQNSSKDTTGQDKDTGEKSPREEKPYQRERRDSIDMDREGRVKDWDKIEY
ncbi:protein starmaker-like isoform X2 [Haliotis rubra]|uniref:protein starmaker-like isoform X2 n=1 Tax=Haliotis rubra TaxID=36100 RepID=UPI001EE513EE|nr:protein starmaker-like isoform X2 [Haliotis rubra]